MYKEYIILRVLLTKFYTTPNKLKQKIETYLGPIPMASFYCISFTSA